MALWVPGSTRLQASWHRRSLLWCRRAVWPGGAVGCAAGLGGPSVGPCPAGAAGGCTPCNDEHRHKASDHPASVREWESPGIVAVHDDFGGAGASSVDDLTPPIYGADMNRRIFGSLLLSLSLLLAACGSGDDGRQPSVPVSTVVVESVPSETAATAMTTDAPTPSSEAPTSTVPRRWSDPPVNTPAWEDVIRAVRSEGANVPAERDPYGPLLLPVLCAPASTFSAVSSLLRYDRPASIDGGLIGLDFMVIGLQWGWVDDVSVDEFNAIADDVRAEFDVTGNCTNPRATLDVCAPSSGRYLDLESRKPLTYTYAEGLPACTVSEELPFSGQMRIGQQGVSENAGEFALDLIDVRSFKSNSDGETTGASVLLIGRYALSGATFFVSVEVKAADIEEYEAGFTPEQVGELTAQLTAGVLSLVQGGLELRIDQAASL
jgi:hypothetical protein